MIQLGNLEIDTIAYSRLASAANEVSSTEEIQFQRVLPKAAAEARAIAGHWEFAAPARTIDRVLSDLCIFPTGCAVAEKTRLRRAAVARLALGFFFIKDRLPVSVMALYPAFFDRLAKFVTEDASDSYDEDYYAKDIRYALGLTVPCGVLQLDLDYRIGPKIILRDAMATRSPRAAVAYLASLSWGRWYNDHLDPRALEEFTPAGWTSCFVRIAEMLALNPDVGGVAGVGWIYDPKVSEISPRLGYVRQTQAWHGAFLANMGTGSHHVANATFKSPTRRKLCDEGKYIPTCYLIAWPRRALIKWSDCLKLDPSIGFESVPA